MNEVFKDCIVRYSTVYLDDIVICSDSLENHHEHVKLILRRLSEHKLRAKLPKYKFGVQEFESLQARKLEMNPNKATAIRFCKRPIIKKNRKAF